MTSEKMFLECHQVVEGIDAPQIAGVDQAHEYVPDERSVLRLKEEGIFVRIDG